MVPLLPALAGGLVALAVGLTARPLGTRLGLLDFPDDPGGRKRHALVTPLVGGVAVVVAGAGALLAVALGRPDYGSATAQALVRIALAVAAMFLIGAADDRFELSVRIRLAAAAVVLALVVVAVPDLAIAFVRFGREPVIHLLGWAGIPFTLLCLVGLLNAVNMADGKNGIVIGLALVWSAFLIGHLPAPLLPVIAALAAALAVLFVFNLRGRLFLGDGGSYAVSALFGLLAIDAYNHDFAAVGADDVALLFAVPVFDTLRLLVVRAARRQSPFAGGRDHLHHYLFDRVGWPRGLYLYLGLAGVPVAAAALVPGTGLAWLAATAVAYAALIAWAQRGPRLGHARPNA